MNNSKKITGRNFTLIELIAVFIIVGLVTSVAVAKFGKKPTVVVIQDVVSHIEVLMQEGSKRASLQGKAIDVVYEEENRLFRVDSDKEGFTNSMLNKKYSTYKVSDEATIEFDNDLDTDDENGIRFSFYPDGTGSGPEFKVLVKGHARFLKISPLTGMVLVTDEE